MSFANTSLLINRQVPEFVREEYPLFISFLEAYYEFLEQKQPGQLNDLTRQAKNLRNISDVDLSIEQFETSFFNTFASLIPRDSLVSRDFLIKNVLPLYLSKGNEASFKLLFRMLYNDEVTFSFPKNNVLRASDGKWEIDTILKIETNVRSIHTGNGSKTIFEIAQSVDANEIDVFVDSVLKTHGTDYFIRKETQKIVFTTAPASNSTIEVFYNDFKIDLLNNRKLTGLTSGATAIVEKAVPKVITDRLNFGLPFEIFISPKTLIGSFENGEKIECDIIGLNDTLITIVADTFSVLARINVTDGGSSYNVGDLALILGGGATDIASAEVESVTDGFTTRIVVDYGGAGFKLASIITSSNTPGSTIITGAVDGVNTSHTTANSYIVIGTDIIQSFNGNTNAVNTLISAANYGFPGPYTENVNTRIIDALTQLEVTDLGPITNAVILFSNVSVNTATLDSQGALYAAGNSFFDIKDFGSIGRIDINPGGSGSGYKIGDEINFGSSVSGSGAAAAVRTVNATGAIVTTQIQPPRITGTANVLNNTVEIIGTGTNFTSDLQIGDKIVIRSQERFINAISSTTSANVNVAFSWTDGTTYANNYKVGSFSKGLVGGTNYVQNSFPTITVSTASGGSGANLSITALMGNGERLRAFTDTIAGQITSIILTSTGSGYKYIPQVDLTNSGDGSAIAEAILGASQSALPGRWTTTDSIISSSERRLQGNDYYLDFSYVTSSLTSFIKYKEILKQLLHPAGFINYANLEKSKDINSNNLVLNVETSNTISGFVNTTNSSIYIVGTGTRFNIANTNGIISVGSNVAVNGQIRTISSIISNTNLSVSSAFTMNSSSQTLIILS